MRYLFDEVALSLPTEKRTSIAIAGFSFSDGRTGQIIELLNEFALLSMSGVDNLMLIERGKLDTILKEQKLELSGLINTSEAIRVGRLTAAEWLLTGTVIEMPKSLVVFVRVIDVESGEIIAVSQVLLAKAPDIVNLL